MKNKSLKRSTRAQILVSLAFCQLLEKSIFLQTDTFVWWASVVGRIIVVAWTILLDSEFLIIRLRVSRDIRPQKQS